MQMLAEAPVFFFMRCFTFSLIHIAKYVNLPPAIAFISL